MKIIGRALAFLLPFVFSLPVVHGQRWLHVSAETCNYGGEILSIEALDERTVQFRLCYPDSAFTSKVAFGAFAIHPSEYLQATGGTGALLEHPVGTGAYQFERWERGSEIVLSRYDNYWGPLAFEPELIFRWNAEAAGRYNALEAGQVDGIDNPGRAEFEMIHSDPQMALYPRPSTAIFYIGINNRFPPFDNVLVRQAMAYAIDKQRIIEQYYPEGSTPADQFMPPSIFGYTPEVRPTPYNLDRARQRLEESGVALPIRAKLSYRNVVRGYLPQPHDVAVEIQQELAQIGIEVELDEMESSTFLDASTAGDLPLFLLGWLPDYPDATNFLDFHFGASASESFGDKFPEITQPLLQASRLFDPDERYPFYVQANTAIQEKVPMIPVAYAGSAAAFRARIAGAHSSPLSFEYFAVMDDPDDDNIIWMQNAEPISLYCADELDGESFRVCNQVHEALLTFSIAGTTVIPALAVDYSASENADEWTFRLREGVTFHDGSSLDANDVVLSFTVQWDAANPLHIGREGTFTYFSTFFGHFLNEP
jgi:ABC-type transport system substrate-binding protein